MRVRAEIVERARAWDEAKEKENAEIAGIAAEAREKEEAEVEARVRENPTLFRGQQRRLIPRSYP